MKRISVIAALTFIILIGCADYNHADDLVVSNKPDSALNDMHEEPFDSEYEPNSATTPLPTETDDSNGADNELIFQEPKNFTSRGTGIIESQDEIDAIYDAIDIVEIQDSSCFSAVGYSNANRIFYCMFVESGAEYIYLDVPPSVYKELMSADSKGGYFNKVIKPYYECRKIGN